MTWTKEQHREYSKNWHRNRVASNIFYLKVKDANRRAKCGNKVSIQDMELLLEEQNTLCSLCDKALGNDIVIDHKIPLVKGGLNVISNICLVHSQCNGRKSTLRFDVAREVLTSNGTKKYCSKCDAVIDIALFGNNKNTLDKKQSWCRKHMAEYMRPYNKARDRRKVKS